MKLGDAPKTGSADEVLASARAEHPFAYSPELAPGLVRALELGVFVATGFALWLALESDRPEYLPQHVFCIGFVAFVYLLLSNWAGLTTVNAVMRPLVAAENVLIAIVTAFLSFLSVIYSLDVSYIYDYQWVLSFSVSVFIIVILVRVSVFLGFRRMAQRRVIGRHLAVLGVTSQSARFLRKVRRDPPYFTAIVGVFTAQDEERVEQWEGTPVLGSIEELLVHARHGLVDDIVVAMPWSADKVVVDAIERLKELPVNVYLASDLVGFDLAFRPVLGTFGQLPMFEVVQRPIAGWSSALKALLDYSLALIALVVLSPLLAIIAIAIRLESPGPVFFVQPRLGFNNRPFSIYKFRSMRNGADKGPQTPQATRNDPRVTRVGRIIRATSLDELPQLFNVLNGTMSLVGPRPHAISHNEEYGRQIRGYFARHKVKPGITGWAQVNGYRGETETIDKMRRRIEHDVFYADNWSLLFDIKIIFKTIVIVFFQKAAY